MFGVQGNEKRFGSGGKEERSREKGKRQQKIVSLYGKLKTQGGGEQKSRIALNN